MQLTQLQRVKVILVLNFVIIFAVVVATPFFIKQGFAGLTEELVEGIFLGMELIFAVGAFRYYDRQTKKKEEEAMLLNVKLEKKERELLNALEYLGKVNVQVSMIRSVFETTKVPSTKNQLNEMYSELLRMVKSVTKEKIAYLRIVNLKTKRTVGESVEIDRDAEEWEKISIGNSELVEKFNKKDRSDENGKKIFFSDSENFYIKTFIFVPRGKGKHFLSEEKVFIEAIANQCEILFLLFNSRYYRK